MTTETSPTAEEAAETAPTAAEPPSESTALQALNSRRADPLSNVELEVEVVLGRKRMLFRDVRALRVGAPIELDRGRNEPVDMLVNGSPFAKGEIVVIGDQNLGVRVTEMLPAAVGGCWRWPASASSALLELPRAPSPPCPIPRSAAHY